MKKLNQQPCSRFVNNFHMVFRKSECQNAVFRGLTSLVFEVSIRQSEYERDSLVSIHWRPEDH